jgi:hypothetical protein
LVDASGEGECPAVVDDLAGDGDFELGGGVFGGSLGAELVMPVGAELGAPETGGRAGRIAGAEGEVGEFTHAEAGGALIEVEVHQEECGVCRNTECGRDASVGRGRLFSRNKKGRPESGLPG